MPEIAVRCFTCGTVTGNKWEKYVALLKAGNNQTKALDALGLRRPCCRRMLLTHVDLSFQHLKFKGMETAQNVNVPFGGADEFGDDFGDDDS